MILQVFIFEECVLNSCYSKYQSQGCRVEDLHIVTSLTDKINEQISNNRKSYFLNLSNQLNDKCLNPKKYWTLLRSFYNGRKVPLIPPILKGNKYVSDFKEKANYFNEFFSLQCSPVVNSSVLPDKSYLTASSLSVRMMKICDDAIVEPLKMPLKIHKKMKNILQIIIGLCRSSQ